MRTVIVEDVETAEAKQQRLATTAVDAALEILRTEASGLVIEAAAPLVFQGLCRKLVYDARTGLSHLETVRDRKSVV